MMESEFGDKYDPINHQNESLLKRKYPHDDSTPDTESKVLKNDEITSEIIIPTGGTWRRGDEEVFEHINSPEECLINREESIKSSQESIDVIQIDDTNSSREIPVEEISSDDDYEPVEHIKKESTSKVLLSCDSNTVTNIVKSCDTKNSNLQPDLENSVKLKEENIVTSSNIDAGVSFNNNNGYNSNLNNISVDHLETEKKDGMHSVDNIIKNSQIVKDEDDKFKLDLVKDIKVQSKPVHSLDIEVQLHRMFGDCRDEDILVQSSPKKEIDQPYIDPKILQKSKVINDLVEIFGFDEAYIKLYKGKNKNIDRPKNNIIKNKKPSNKENQKFNKPSPSKKPKLSPVRPKGRPKKIREEKDEDFIIDDLIDEPIKITNVKRRVAEPTKRKNLTKVIIGQPKRIIIDINEAPKIKRGPPKRKPKPKPIENIGDICFIDDGLDQPPEALVDTSGNSASESGDSKPAVNNSNFFTDDAIADDRLEKYDTIYFDKLQDKCLEGHQLNMFKASVNVNTGQIRVFCDICEKRIIMNTRS